MSSIAITGQSGIQNNFLNPGDNVSFTATFSETVILDNASGSPIINTIVVGSANREATYTSGSNSDNLTFRYTIKSLNFSGENDADGISVGSGNIVLPGNSTITDVAGNNAILSHSGMNTNSGYKVDTLSLIHI